MVMTAGALLDALPGALPVTSVLEAVGPMVMGPPKPAEDDAQPITAQAKAARHTTITIGIRRDTDPEPLILGPRPVEALTGGRRAPAPLPGSAGPHGVG